MFGLFTKYPRLVRFNSGKFGVEIRSGTYLDLRRDRRGYTWSDLELIMKYCQGTEKEARAALAAYPFPATPVRDSNTDDDYCPPC